MVWRTTSQTIFKWYLWIAVKTFTWFYILWQTTGSFKWIKFILWQYQRRVSSRLYFRTIMVSDLHQRFIKWRVFKFQPFCWRYVSFFNIQSSAATLRNDLAAISNWSFQWWILMLTWISKCKRWYSVEKLRNCFTLVFFSMTFFQRIVYLKNILGWH